MSTISIVIPTYKRTESLSRLLKSIEKQTVLPNEVIVISAGIEKGVISKIISTFSLPIILLFSEPSVCKQRNIGIKHASSDYIHLCDDDIEIPKNYLETLSNYLLENPKINIVSGEETQLVSENKWEKLNQKISIPKLYFNFIFGLPFWSDLKLIRSKLTISSIIIKYYYKKQNDICKSGWPYVNDFTYPIMKTTIYGLGCAMFKANVLKRNLYDENLEQYGLGDNYDVALRINQFKNKIHVLRIIPYKHYKAKSNRLVAHKQYYIRTKTLYNFIDKLSFFTLKNKLFFIWSLIGNGILFLFGFKFKYFYENIKVGVYAAKSIIRKGI